MNQDTVNTNQDKKSYGNQRLSVIPARAVTDPNLSDSAFRTLAAIGTFGDRNGWCYPSYSTLAAMRGVTKQAIAKHVAELVERGYLNVHHRYDKATGAQQTSMLQIRLDYEPEADEAATLRSHPRQRSVDPPSTSEVDPPSTPEVDPPSTPEVDPPSTPEVDANLTPHINDPFNAPFNGGGVKPRQPGVDGASPPPPPVSAPGKHPGKNSVCQAEELYRRLRPSHLIIPRTRWYEEALAVLEGVLERHGGDQEAAAEELRPYAEEADRRGIAPTNLCWLTEWAASGSIPPDRRGGQAKSPEADPYEGYGSPYKPPTPAQLAKRRALAGRVSQTLGIPIEKARSLVDENYPPRVEECLSLWPLLQRRGLATLEVLEALLYYEGISVEEVRTRLEKGEPLLPGILSEERAL